MKFRNIFKRTNKGIGATALQGYHAPALTDDTVRMDVAIHSAVRSISHAIAQCSWSSDSPIVHRFLQNPNQLDTPFEWLTCLVHSLMFYGISPQLVIQTHDNIVMVPLDPTKFKERVTNTGLIEYEYTPTYGKRETYTTSDVCLFKDTRVVNGSECSRVQAAKSRIESLALADRSISSVLKNGITASWILSNEGPQLDEESRRAFLKALKAELSNVSGKNTGGVLLLGPRMKAERIATGSPADSDLRDLRESYLREAAAGLGVPPFLVGASGDTRYNNISARMTAMYRDVFSPLISNIEQRASKFLGATVVCDRWQLEAGDYKTQTDIIATSVGRPIWTPNEARQRLGMQPIDDPYADELGSDPINPRKPDYQSDTGRGDGPDDN